MPSIKVIGIGLGKSNFHICVYDSHCRVLEKKKPTRPKLLAFLAQAPATTVAFEACVMGLLKDARLSCHG